MSPARLNNFWCVEHWRLFVVLSQAAQDFANHEAQRLMAESEAFRRAVQAKRRQWGIGTNNAADLVVLDWVKRYDRAMCCLLGGSVIEKILKGARERD